MACFYLSRTVWAQGSSFVVVLCCLFWCQSFGDVSLDMFSPDFSSVSVATKYTRPMFDPSEVEIGLL